MADLLISPEGYTTPGGVPRKLLAGVFLVITLSAMLVFMLTSNDEPLMTGDQKARAELMKPETVAAQAKGNGKWVDEAAEKARRDSEATEKNRLAARAAGDDAGHHAVAISYVPPPADTTRARSGAGLPEASDPSPGRAASPDPAAVERDVSARSAAATVFDDGAKSGPSAAVESLADAAQGLATRGLAAAGERGDTMGSMIEAVKAAQAGPSPAPTRAESDRAWANQFTRPANAPVLRQQAAETDLMLYQGTVIPCVLTRRLNSDMPGVVTARVSMDVYDSRTSRRLLLPKGALLVGAYNNDVKQGQSRLQFAFTRLRMPDGSTFELPGATGADGAGQAGIDGQVNRHFFRSFGSALLLGVLADRVTRIAALPSGGANGQGGVSATGQVFVDTARSELERNRAIPPTVTVEEGARLNVEVVRDMAFESVYRGV